MQSTSSFPPNQSISEVYGSEGAQIFVGHAGRDVIITRGEDRQETLDKAIDNCRSNLFLSDPEIDRANLISAKGERVDGTCEWVERNDAYNSWLRGDPRLLWICGGPGKGKTMLSIFLTERLERRKQAIYYFCSSEHEQRNTATAILRGLLWRITAKRRELTRHLLDYFGNPRLTQATLSSRETLWSLFKTILQDPELGELFCVLDGLDECTLDSSRWLTTKLVRFFSCEPVESSNINRTRMVVVSQDMLGLRQEAQVRFDRDNDAQVASDIKVFASARVRELSGLDGYSEAFRETVETAVLARAEGTFLWIGFVMDELSRKATCTEVLEALKFLPYGLHAYYGRMLLQIQPAHKETSALILRWVTMAQRLLTLRELGSAIGVQSSATIDFDRSIRDQVKICGALLKVQGQEVSLVHHSAREYLVRTQADENAVLEKFRIIPETANLQIARSCLACIERSPLSHKALRKIDLDLREVDLLEYSINFWPKHAAGDLPRTETFFSSSVHFFEKESALRDNWWRTYLDWNPRLNWYQDGLSMFSTPPLHIASYLGLTRWVRMMLAKSNGKPRIALLGRKKDSDAVLPLVYAASRGHDKTVTLLLDHGADINGQNMHQETALFRACRLGHEQTVRVLLSRGANVHVKDSGADTALHEAASAGVEGPVKLLLDYGADPFARNRYGQTALFEATWAGHEVIVRLLLDVGAKINDKDTLLGLKMLSCVARAGHEGILRLLIHRGAGFKDKDDALRCAAKTGEVAAVQLLLDHGANPNTLDARGRTALSEARRSYRTSEAVVGILLDYGADVSHRDGDGNSVLHWAASCSKQLALRLLQEFGVDIHTRNLRGETALHQAASVGNQPIAQLLLDRGARVNDEDQKKETALHRAVHSPDPWLRIAAEPVVRLLLDRGAYLHANYSSGTTLLYCAVLNGERGVVRALLDHGAHVDGMDLDGSTALHAAALEQKETTVQLLLEWGANPCRTNKSGKAALHHVAARRCGAASARLLLEYGAAVNVKDCWNHEPLYYASCTTDGEVVRLLLRSGADPHVKHKGMTALHRAALVGDTAVVQALLDYGAGVNDRENDGKTALWLASSEGNTRAVQERYLHGARMCMRETTTVSRPTLGGLTRARRRDARDQDDNGKMALALAELREHMGVVQLLCSGSRKAISADTSRMRASRQLVIVGDGAYGKTCLLTVFSKGTFPEAYGPPTLDPFKGHVESDGH
ncbi:hypothetical protein LTR37_011866 [Vermiconidia calcicola]|uniref:Uncharacterized protein n=1 Tax=Vermiconidia calcicola TaxID=1690605 RepID=A0ACC3N0Z1_9PEZI|nr:hypothetical protein LTR37_011866 [Vermiconidia calcicola]